MIGLRRPTPLSPETTGARGVDFLMRILRRVCRETGYPTTARHLECSLLLSEDDAASGASGRLLDIACAAIGHARRVFLADAVERMTDRFPAPYPNIWPGEHYRLLAGIVLALQPTLVVEIGTGEGLSALSMVPYLPTGGKVVTFDLVHWADYPRTCLRVEDFEGGRLQQVLGDLSQDQRFARAEEVLRRADLVLVDGPKDQRFEADVVARFSAMRFERRPIFVFDDIRLWPMLRFWRDLKWPKLDVTSFGHWTGTGLSEQPSSQETSA